MKKQIIKATALTMALGMTLSGLTACGGDPIDSAVEGMVNIKVFNMDGGVGTEWFDDAILRFEQKYENKEFADGLKGINVMPTSDAKNGTRILDQIKNDDYAVYFTEEVYYNDFISQNVLADVTDIVTEDLTVYGEDRSIEDKMNTTVRDYLNVNGHYYAVPFWEGYSGIMYDRDLFELKGLFYKTDGSFASPNSFTDGEYTGAGKLASGPDGVEGTADDGLPATYEQFFGLCEYMAKTCSITPFVWPGGYQDYVNEFANQLWADYEGYDRMLMNFTFEGEDDSLVESVDDNGNITFKAKTNIADDISVLTRQAGKYYAIEFISKIMNNLNTYAVSNVMSGSMSHYDCADYFLKGRFESSLPTIGMMINGNWWQNEAKETFAELETTVGAHATLANRRIGMMPLPKARQAGGGRTLQAQKSAFAFINGNIETASTLEAAKLFLQYVCTNESLVKFQQISGMAWALDYSLTDLELDDCSYYARSIYDVHKNATIVYPYSKNQKYVTKTSVIMNNRTPWTTQLKSGAEYGILTNAFYNNSSLTAKQYFDGLKNLV